MPEPVGDLGVEISKLNSSLELSELSDWICYACTHMLENNGELPSDTYRTWKGFSERKKSLVLFMLFGWISGMQEGY